jgi:hypothetical protein
MNASILLRGYGSHNALRHIHEGGYGVRRIDLTHGQDLAARQRGANPVQAIAADSDATKRRRLILVMHDIP